MILLGKIVRVVYNIIQFIGVGCQRASDESVDTFFGDLRPKDIDIVLLKAHDTIVVARFLVTRRVLRLLYLLHLELDLYTARYATFFSDSILMIIRRALFC